MNLRIALAALAFAITPALADDAPTAPAPAGDAAPTPDADSDTATPPPAPIVTSGPMVRMETSMGTIVIALDDVHAPKSVANFLRYVKEKAYDGSAFYRIQPNFVLQAGSYDAKYEFKFRKGGLHGPIPLESNNGLNNVKGAIAMAHGDKPDSATVDFFIDLSDVPGLDPDPKAPPNTTGYAVFGHVIEGLDVLDRIGSVKTGSGRGPFPKNAPYEPVVIQKVTITRAKP